MKREWHLLLPDSVRETLAIEYQDYLDMAKVGAKLPSKKKLRAMAALMAYMGEKE